MEAVCYKLPKGVRRSNLGWLRKVRALSAGANGCSRTDVVVLRGYAFFILQRARSGQERG